MSRFIYIIFLLLISINLFSFDKIADEFEKSISNTVAQIEVLADNIFFSDDDWENIYPFLLEQSIIDLKNKIKEENDTKVLEEFKQKISKFGEAVKKVFEKISLLYSIQMNPKDLDLTLQENFKNTRAKAETVYEFLGIENPKEVSFSFIREKIQKLKQDDENSWRQIDYVFRNNLSRTIYDLWKNKELGTKSFDVEVEYNILNDVKLLLADLEALTNSRIKILN